MLNGANFILFGYNDRVIVTTVKGIVAQTKYFQDCRLFVFLDFFNEQFSNQLLLDIKSQIPTSLWFQIEISETPQGLRASILNGLDRVSNVSKHDDILIVFEDDVQICSPIHSYIKEHRQLLTTDHRCFSLGMYNSPTELLLNFDAFRNRFDCWGWVTTVAKWREFRKYSAAELMSRALNARKGIPQQTMDRFEGILSGKLDLWAAQVNVFCHVLGKYNVKPSISLVQNVGQLRKRHLKLRTKLKLHSHPFLNQLRKSFNVIGCLWKH